MCVCRQRGSDQGALTTCVPELRPGCTERINPLPRSTCMHAGSAATIYALSCARARVDLPGRRSALSWPRGCWCSTAGRAAPPYTT